MSTIVLHLVLALIILVSSPLGLVAADLRYDSAASQADYNAAPTAAQAASTSPSSRLVDQPANAIPTTSCADVVPPSGPIDMADIMSVAARWGQQGGDPGWDARFDLDGDNAITVNDITLAASAWQSTCLPPDPGSVAPPLDPSVVSDFGGITQTLTTLHVRATEYTVGDRGPEAMPADLPANSGYTYAVELSVDEALAVGATRVDFSQPVVQYLDNFLSFPIGMLVPSGYYDRGRGVWAPSDNGRVIEILSISNGVATLDTDGDGLPDPGTALGVTLAERQQLASLYPAGQGLWRVPIPHFTLWDFNYPYVPDCNPAIFQCQPKLPSGPG